MGEGQAINGTVLETGVCLEDSGEEALREKECGEEELIWEAIDQPAVEEVNTGDEVVEPRGEGEEGRIGEEPVGRSGAGGDGAEGGLDERRERDVPLQSFRALSELGVEEAK